MSALRPTFALQRSPWDAFDTVGEHTFFAALVAALGIVLTLFFAARGELQPALYVLAAVGLAFLVIVAFEFAKAFANPGKHRDWEWVDYTGYQEDLMRLELRSLTPLRPRRWQQGLPRPLLCRVIAPDGSVWDSFQPSPATPERPWAGSSTLRFYPSDFRCPTCRQQPPAIQEGEYLVTWWELRRVFRRPLLRHSVRQSFSHEQALESDEPAS
jgi:hypothetical protein